MPLQLHDAFERYLLALRNTPAAEQTEMTSRSALEQLLNEAARNFAPAGTTVIHEPRRAQDRGAPDFKISARGLTLGYVENKALGENLSKVAKSDQIRKYLGLSSNILLTDYLNWFWITPHGIQEARLANPAELDDRTARVRPAWAQEMQKLLQGFFSEAPQEIGTAKALAEALATRSQLLRDFLGEELVRQQEARAGGVLMGLYQAFRQQVSHEITLKEFADAFAQTLAYGLFLAKLNAAPTDAITLLNAKQFVPASFGLIQELVGFLDRLDQPDYADIRWVVEEVLSIINSLNLDAIHADLTFRKRKARRAPGMRSEEEWRLFSRDPFIYFYEDYLAKYDAKMRKGRGVYYTPPPIVNFIVRAINDILKDTFGISEGLADRKRVTVLDFATGTGTFLVEVLERIFEEIGGPNSGKAPLVVRDHILKNIYGFEYLIAPYTIAHLKLSQYLRDKESEAGRKVGEFGPHDDERFQVFLTNTLEPIEPQLNHFLPELSRETEAAQAIKDKPILVITGNPPYAGHSRNPSTRLVPYESLTEDVKRRGKVKVKSIRSAQGSIKMAEVLTDIGAAIEGYKTGPSDLSKPLQGKWLQNDYIKFIRFAQKKMDEVDRGIVAIITSNSFLDGQTYAYMRHSLSRTFDQMHFIDLHGNSDRGERSPDGDVDGNIFDIQTGVCISVFVKSPGLARKVLHTDWWGKQIEKYQRAADSSMETEKFSELQPHPPHFLFIPERQTTESDYHLWPRVDAIFSRTGKAAPGLITLHDDFAISFSESESLTKISRLVSSSSEEEARRLFNLCKQNQWTYSQAKEALANTDVRAETQQILYRPFDYRWTVWNTSVSVHLRQRVNRHLRRDNIGLVTTRATKGETFGHVMVTDRPIEAISLSSKTSNNAFLFPLYLYAAPKDEYVGLFESDDPFAAGERIENIAPAFRRWLDSRYDAVVTPEQLFGYIFAVLHAPAYRSVYADFLRTDFPRIPFPGDLVSFQTLAALGWELSEVQLMRRPVPNGGKLGAYFGSGGNVVDKPRWSEAEQTVWINANQGFGPVAREVWAFTIGGYQVIEKYLKSRKGLVLSLDEIENVEKVTNILAFTLGRMEQIDEAYAETFPVSPQPSPEQEDDVEIDEAVMSGAPVFRGTRIPVRAIAEMLDAGADEEEMLAGYPKLDRARLALARRWAAANPSTPIPPDGSNFRPKLVSERRYPREDRPKPGSDTKKRA